jgi:hypothetical protein
LSVVGAKAVVGAGIGTVTGVSGALVGGWPAAVLLAVPFAAVLLLLAWVVADTGRTRRLAVLIGAVRTPAPRPGRRGPRQPGP